MELTSIIYCALAIVAMSFCGADERFLAPGGSYTDSLLGGLRRHSGVSKGALVNTGFSGCNCPLGTVCSVELGIRRCIPTNIDVAVHGHGNAIGLVPAPGLIGSGAVVGGAIRRAGAVLGNIVGGAAQLLRCGRMPIRCQASVRDIFPMVKYTFDHALNACVQINVCKSCAHITSIAENLFDSVYDCSHACAGY